MYLTEHFGLSLSALVVWGLMMGLFFNLFLWIADLKRNNVLLISSFIVFTSYFISDHLFTWFDNSNIYLNWAIYDVVTITLIIISAYLVKNNAKSPAFFYVISVLSVNTILSSSMYYDLRISENTTPWVLWDIYSFGVYFLDFTMIVALIVDRDILGLIRLKNAIKALFKTHHVKHSI